MPIHCPLCNRVNPPEARYCFHDGAALGARPGGPIAVGAQPFASPFVFPSGRFCRSFDELVIACEEHWEEARDLLREGLLESFFAGMGRSDLSWLARRCAAAHDPDVGLDELLAQLPGDVRKPAQLVLQPQEVNLGCVAQAADHRFVIHLFNEGMGLIRGSIAVAGPEWLALGEEGGPPDKVFQFRSDQEVTVRVAGKRLRAGVRPQEGRLVVASNGGAAVVVVRVETPRVVPFAQGVLAGADTPRRLAEMAKAAPREAADFFESGAVAAWYGANGWTYPVQGPPAAGVAALQQFYEALGLAAPPRVELDRQIVRLQGAPGESLEAFIVVQTTERRPVFAHATTAEPWLEIDRAVSAGRTARIPVRVPSVPDRPGEVLCGRMQVTANGNQRFVVTVTLTILDDVVAADDDRSSRGRSREGASVASAGGRPGLLVWLFAGAFLLVALAAVGIVTAVVVLTPEASPTPALPVTHAPPDAPPTEKPHPPKDDNSSPRDEPPPKPPEPPPPDANDLARQLQSDDVDARPAALKKLAAMGRKAAPALNAVLKAMKDGDADFRREALVDLPKIGPPTAADVDALADLVRDVTFPEGRAYALDALAALGPDAKPAAAAVCDALEDRNAATRRKAAEVLGDLGPAGRDAARHDLIDALHDADPDVGAAAAAALARQGPPTLADAPTLQMMLHDKTEAARRFALTGFRDLGTDAAGSASYLEESLSADASPEMRRLALAALLAAAPHAPHSIDAFTKAVSDADPEVRQAAVAALAKAGVAHGALPGLVRALGSEDEAMAKAAEDALKAVHWDAKGVAELGDELPKSGAAMQLRLLALLKPLGVDAGPAVPGICMVLKSGAGEPRTQAFALLEAMGPAAGKASGALNELLNDDKFAVRLDAATALAAIEGPDAPEAVPVLIEALRVEQLDDAQEAAERDRAVEALGKIGAPAVKPLLDALQNDFIGGGVTTVKGKINESARLAAVQALAAMGPAADTPRTRSVLGQLIRLDSSQAVRDEARKVWDALKRN